MLDYRDCFIAQAVFSLFFADFDDLLPQRRNGIACTGRIRVRVAHFFCRDAEDLEQRVLHGDRHRLVSGLIAAVHALAVHNRLYKAAVLGKQAIGDAQNAVNQRRTLRIDTFFALVIENCGNQEHAMLCKQRIHHVHYIVNAAIHKMLHCVLFFFADSGDFSQNIGNFAVDQRGKRLGFFNYGNHFFL